MLQPEGVKEQENLVCKVEQISLQFKEALRCLYKRFGSFISFCYNRTSV